MIRAERFFPPHAFAFKLGGALDPLGLFKDKPSPTAAALDAVPVPLPGKPLTASSAEVLQSQGDYLKDNLLKKSVKKTIMAGDTGGFKKPNLGNATAPIDSYRKLG